MLSALRLEHVPALASLEHILANLCAQSADNAPRKVVNPRCDWSRAIGRRPHGSHCLHLRASPYAKISNRSVIEHAGDALVVVVWQHASEALARRLGIVYCFNRPCALHAVPAPPRPQPPPQSAAGQEGGGPAALSPAAEARSTSGASFRGCGRSAEWHCSSVAAARLRPFQISP